MATGSLESQNDLEGVENVFEKHFDSFEHLLKKSQDKNQIEDAAFAKIHREEGAPDNIFLEVESGEQVLESLKQKLKSQSKSSADSEIENEI